MFTTDKYDIDTEAVFLRLSPSFWLITPETGEDKVVWSDYLKLVSTMLKNIQEELLNNANKFHTFLSYTGQHLSLEKLLNDNFDNSLRRIFITENNISISNYIWYLQGETDPDNKVWYTQGETDPSPKDWYTEIELSSILNFTVNIPTTLTINENELRALMASYVVNGYDFNIIYF